MIEVYAIVSAKNGEIYVGMAPSAEKRLKEHNGGKKQVYERIKTMENISFRIFSRLVNCKSKKKYLKSGIGKEYLKSLVP